MVVKFENFINESMRPAEKDIHKATVIITELDQLRYFHIDELYEGELKKIFEEYKSLVDELSEKYKDRFYLPIDTVGFSTEVAIIGKDFDLANAIAKQLYDKMKSFHKNFKVMGCIGYGDMYGIAKRLHWSGGPVFWKVGRTLDKMKEDGILILKDEIVA